LYVQGANEANIQTVSAGTQYILGATNITGNLVLNANTAVSYDAATGQLNAGIFNSTVATGTAPLTVASTTRVASLYVDGSNVSNIQLSSAGNFYLTGVSATSGNLLHNANAAIYANFSNGAIHAATFVGALSGTVSITGTNGEILYNNGGVIATATGVTFPSAGRITTTGIISAGANIVTSGNVNATSGNVIGGNVGAIGNVGALGNVNVGANLVVTGKSNLNAVGNVTITGGTAGQFLKTDGAGVLSWDNPSLANGTSSVTIPTVNGDVIITSGGTATITATSTGANISGYANVSGNVEAGNVVTTGNVDADFFNATSDAIIGGNVDATGNVTGGNLITTGDVITPSLTTGAAATTGTITGTWSLSAGSSLQATYADLAEYYAADYPYPPGTVLEFGGNNEVTLASDETRCVAGVVTTNPAYVMNTDGEGDILVAIALVGRVPVKVRGKISKGDLMTSGGNGYARPTHDPKLGTIIGKSLENFDGGDGMIEIAVARH
jgi:hypothetical protein